MFSSNKTHFYPSQAHKFSNFYPASKSLRNYRSFFQRVTVCVCVCCKVRANTESLFVYHWLLLFTVSARLLQKQWVVQCTIWSPFEWIFRSKIECTANVTFAIDSGSSEWERKCWDGLMVVESWSRTLFKSKVLLVARFSYFVDELQHSIYWDDFFSGFFFSI